MKEKCENVCELDTRYSHLEARVSQIEKNIEPFAELRAKMLLLEQSIDHIKEDTKENSEGIKRVKELMTTITEKFINFTDKINKKDFSFRLWVISIIITIIFTAGGGMVLWYKLFDSKIEKVYNIIYERKFENAIPNNSTNNHGYSPGLDSNIKKKD